MRVVERNMDKEYAGITGVLDFTKASARLALGADNPLVKEGTVSIVKYCECNWDIF